MIILNTITEIKSFSLECKKKHKTIAFVPTMGALHDGHLSLINTAKQYADIIVMSIFVNRIQFAPHEDFDSYPRDDEHDLNACKVTGVSCVFMPNTDSIYPNIDDYTKIEASNIAKPLCGASRPHFFSGVLSVLVRLFNLVQADYAVFGEKDFQQFAVIKQCCTDLFMPISIISSPLIREKNGLAMSSRNRYLSQADIDIASSIYTALSATKKQYRSGETNIDNLLIFFRNQLHQSIHIDYLDILDERILEKQEACTENSRLFFAGFLNNIRLIDNLKL